MKSKTPDVRAALVICAGFVFELPADWSPLAKAVARPWLFRLNPPRAPMENAREDVRRLVDESGNFSSSENWKTFGQLVARPTANKTAASHDELLKDEKHYGILQWGGGHIVVRTDGRREILSRDNVQAFTGASTEHMCEHLNSIGLWAEVYKPRGEAPRVSDTPTKTPPPSPENNSPDAWLPKTYDEVF